MAAMQKSFTNKRPLAHFTPPKGWMNDPNGLIYAYGYYHLFYQHNPHILTHGPMYWGHARSDDLLNWDHLPIALSPDALGDIFSGTAILDENNVSGLGEDGIAPLLLFFTHHRRTPEEGQVQVQSLAYSTDKGETFVKYPHNPLITMEHAYDFRDPKVFWHSESNAFVMLVAAGRKLVLYRSENLLAWEKSGEFSADRLQHKGILECPDLIFTEGKWVLVVSLTIAGDDDWKTVYWIGSFDGFNFTTDIETFYTLDYGCDNYAAATFSGLPRTDAIQIGLMNCWSYADKIPTPGFRGAMTIPRKLCLVETLATNGWRLSQLPAVELSNKLVVEAGMSYALPDVPFVLSANFAYGDCGIVLENDTDEFTIRFDSKQQQLVCDRSKCGDTSFSSNFKKQLCADIEYKPEVLDLLVVVDVTSVEVFALSGTVVISAQCFLDSPFLKVSAF